MRSTTGHDRFRNHTQTCSDIIGICNNYHIPLKCFLKIGDEETSLIRVDDWQIVTESLCIFPDIAVLDMKVEDLIGKLGISTATWFRHQNGFAETTVFADYLTWTSKLGINISPLIQDPNDPIPDINGYKSVPTVQTIIRRMKKAEKENGTLKIENRQLRKILKSIQTMLNAFHRKPSADVEEYAERTAVTVAGYKKYNESSDSRDGQ